MVSVPMRLLACFPALLFSLTGIRQFKLESGRVCLSASCTIYYRTVELCRSPVAHLKQYVTS